MAVARHHLTLGEKNKLRAIRRERPDLTQEQLREWVHTHFGKWIGRSTIGKIASSPEDACVNPEAKRVQSGRYPEMEQQLFEFVQSEQQEELGDENVLNLSEGLLWTKANELLQRLKGPSQSVSLGWVQRFKKRHGLHRSQREVGDTIAGNKRTREQEMNENVYKRATPPLSKGRKQFVSADDILLLTQVLSTKPWTFVPVMDGWQLVCDQLRTLHEFQLDKTAGACQARVTLLLDHLRAGNVAALRKAGTSEEYERKRELLVEVLEKQNTFEEAQEDARKRRGEPSMVATVTKHEAAVVKVGEVAAAIAVAEATGEAERDSQRRLELLEIRMERELAEQRRHADEQVRELERLQRVQLEAQQTQHAQLLATIQQQQAMMLDLIKSVAAHAKSKD